MNVTLSIDDQVVARARRLAATRGTSLNQLIRDYLEDLTPPGRRAVGDRTSSMTLGPAPPAVHGALGRAKSCMKGREFVDTNVLIHADDDRDPQKRDLARDLIRALLRGRRGVLSLQVLQEFFAAATRKLGMSGEEAKRRVVPLLAIRRRHPHTGGFVRGNRPAPAASSLDLGLSHRARRHERQVRHAAYGRPVGRSRHRIADGQQPVRRPRRESISR